VWRDPGLRYGCRSGAIPAGPQQRPKSLPRRPHARSCYAKLASLATPLRQMFRLDAGLGHSL